LVTLAPKVQSPTQQESSETPKSLSVRQRRGETLEIPKDKEKDKVLQMRHKLAELIGKIDKETKTLNQIVLGNHNTKREIKESNTKIRSLMCQVMTAEMLSMLKTQGDKADVQAEVKVNKKDYATQTMEGERKDDDANKKDGATQTTDWEQKDDEVELLRERIKNPESALDLFETDKRKWPEDVFLKTKPVHVHPLKQWPDPLVFFVADKKAAKTDEVLKKLGETHMGLKKVIEENRLKNDLYAGRRRKG
jgi:hypothetical protein